MSQYSSKDISEQDPMVIAKQAEQDLNSYDAKQGHHKPGHAGVGPSDSSELPSGCRRLPSPIYKNFLEVTSPSAF